MFRMKTNQLWDLNKRRKMEMRRSQSQEIRRKGGLECPRTGKMGKTNSDLEADGGTGVAAGWQDIEK